MGTALDLVADDARAIDRILAQALAGVADEFKQVVLDQGAESEPGGFVMVVRMLLVVLVLFVCVLLLGLVDVACGRPGQDTGS